MTVSDRRRIPGGWSPDGKWITFQSDHDGDEQWDLFAVPTETGEMRNLTRTPEISEESPRWSPDGKLLAYVSKPKSGQLRNPCHGFRHGPHSRNHETNSARFQQSPPGLVADGRRLAFTKGRADQKVDIIFVAELRTGALRRLSPEGGEHSYHAADWPPSYPERK